MTEIRRPSDTVRIDRAEIEAELARHRRESAPPPVLRVELAHAQGLPLDVCPACEGCGVVDPKIAVRVRLALPSYGAEVLEDEEPVTTT